MKKAILFILLLSFCLAVPGCSYFTSVNPCDVTLGSHKAVTPVSRADRDWWMPRHEEKVALVKQGNVDLLMIGDSITHGWESSGKEVWEKYYTPRKAANIGFSGDKTEHVIWRLQNGEADGISPKLAVIMIGTNNSGGDYTAEQIADGIKGIVCELRNRLPETKILILKIFPRGSYPQRKIKDQDATYNDQWALNDAASDLAAKMADNKMIYYLDINKAFLNDDGVLTREIMPDLLHPKEKGYAIWAEAMEPTIKKLMGE